MRHRGVQVGNFFLAGKEDAPEFSAADEEMLELFASQAASAIAHAHAHRDERRAQDLVLGRGERHPDPVGENGLTM